MEVSELRLYDRQIRAWGAELQGKIRTASVAVCGSSLTAAEVAKNLVMCGFREVFIRPDTLASMDWLEDPLRYPNLRIVSSWGQAVMHNKDMWCLLESGAEPCCLSSQTGTTHRVVRFGFDKANSRVDLDVFVEDPTCSVTDGSEHCVPLSHLPPIEQFEVGDIITYRFMSFFGERCQECDEDLIGGSCKRKVEYISYDPQERTWRSAARLRG